MGKKIYSTDKEKPQLGYSLMLGSILMALMLVVGTSFLPQSTVRQQKKTLTMNEKSKVEAKQNRNYWIGFKPWKLDAVERAALIGKVGSAPKTRQASKQPQPAIPAEGKSLVARQVAAATPSPQLVAAAAGGTRDYSFETLERLKWDYIMSQLEAIKAADLASTRHAVQVSLINDYLNGTPMAGLGEIMVDNAERTGVKCYLCCVQAEAESSRGQACCGSYNSFGMIGMSFGSWEEAIAAYFNNIVAHWGAAQSAYELHGYCVPDEPYCSNVQAVVDSLNAHEEAAMAPAYAKYK